MKGAIDPIAVLDSQIAELYMDAYLHVEFYGGHKYPHGKSITHRLHTPSSMSPDLAEIERMRADALARCGSQP